MNWLVAIFWIGVGTVAYTYAVFPILARALAIRKRDSASAPSPGGEAPLLPVTVIIPAHDEERDLEAKLRNVLSADYRSDLLEVIVVSDASTDKTDDIALGFEREGVRLIVQRARQGKTAGLNRAMAVARGQVAVFTDANAIYPPETIRRLVAYFRDPTVGLVSGYTRYRATASGETAEGTNVYTSLERAIKRAESRWGCCVGADGAIFAMRSSLYCTLRDDDINDLVLPLKVIDRGYRCLLAEDAFCAESPGESLHSEFRRQARITNRSLRAIWRHRRLLNPVRFPVFSFFLFSHKVVRLLAPVLAVASGISLVVLARGGGVYLWLAGTATACALAMAAGYLRPALLSSGRLSRAVRMLNLVAAANTAILLGWWRFVTGKSEATWQHDRALGARE